jgi:ankyrin repeat protein
LSENGRFGTIGHHAMTTLIEQLGLTAREYEMVKGFEEHVRTRARKRHEDPWLQALLMWAVHYGTPAHLHQILAAGADPNFDFFTQTMLGMALHWRGDRDGPEIFRELIRAGADPARHSENRSLMWTASQHGNRQWAIEVLLDVTPKGRLAPEDLATALVNSAHDAARVKRLLSAGADANCRGRSASALLPGTPITALMAAAFHGNPDAVQLLLAAGADMNAQDAEGHTALDYASFDAKRCRKVVALLEKAGGVSSRSFPREQGAATRGFAAAARKPAFKAALARIQELTGVKPAPLVGAEGKIPGGYGFLVTDNAGKNLVAGLQAEFAATGDRARKFVEAHQAEMRARGGYLFHSRDLLDRNGPVVRHCGAGDQRRRWHRQADRLASQPGEGPAVFDHGHRVGFSGGAVYHRHQGSGGACPAHQRHLPRGQRRVKGTCPAGGTTPPNGTVVSLVRLTPKRMRA